MKKQEPLAYHSTIPPLSIPNMQAGKSIIPLVLGLLGSSFVALSIVSIIMYAAPAINPTAIYLYAVVPIGSAGLGFVSTLGLVAAVHFGHYKMSLKHWIIVCVWLSAVYGISIYIEFWLFNLPLSFLTYFHESTIALTFPRGKSDGLVLGYWGYALRFLEVSGCIIGGLILPIKLNSRAYCENCQQFKTVTHIIHFPASTMPTSLFSKKKVQTTYTLETATKDYGKFVDLLQRGKIDEAKDLVQQHQSSEKRHKKLPQRLAVVLEFCNKCFECHTKAVLIKGHGNQTKKQELESHSIPKSCCKAFVS